MQERYGNNIVKMIKHRQQMKRWRKANPVRFRALQMNNRAKQYGATDKVTAEDLEGIYKDQEGCCFYCHREVAYKLTPSVRRKITFDHRVSLSKGGSNTRSNIVVACARCNSAKRHKQEAAFVLDRAATVAHKD